MKKTHYRTKTTNEEDIDKILLENIQKENNHEAFNELFLKYFKKLYIFCYSNTRDAEASKDIVQSIFINIWEKRENISVSGSIKWYLFGAVRNRISSFFAFQKRYSPLEEAIDQPEPFFNPESQFDKKNINQLITDVLPPQMIHIYNMKYIDGMKQKDIAYELKVTESAIEKKVAKIKSHIRKVAEQLDSSLSTYN